MNRPQSMDPTNQNGVVVGIGELLWDCFADSRRPGGAPANVAYHARQLGLDGMICSRVGRDALGDELVQYLAGRGLDTRFVQHDHQHPTGTVTVNTERPDHPSYVIHEAVAWDHLRFDQTWADLFRRAAAVCFGTLAQRSPESRATIRQVLSAASAALRIYDVNLRPPWCALEVIEDSLRRAQVVKLNEDELLTLADRLDLGGSEPGSFGSALRDRFGVQLVCITRGKNGCLLLGPDEQVDLPGQPVQVADAVGAGDAFTAALTFGLIRGWPLGATARLANEAGALVAGRHGAMPELRAEFAALQARLGASANGPRD
jgi:fructokinase